MDTLKNPSEALIAFGKHIGIQTDAWEKQEELEKLIYNDPNFDRTKAANLTLDQIVPLIDTYGNALICRFKLGELIILEIKSDINDESIKQFQDKARHSSTLIFELRLDKSKLLKKLLVDLPPNCRLFLYLFPNALERFLYSELKSIEQSLWGTETKQKVIILVPNHEIWLSGPCLAVLGGKQIEAWRYEAPRGPLAIEKMNKMYLTCKENLKWQESWLQHLTPLHIKVKGNAMPKDPIANALQIHLINSIILYTAEKTVGNADKPEFSTYIGTSQRVEVALANPKSYLGEEEKEGIRPLLKILEWTYVDRWYADRLSFVQISMVQHLYAANPNPDVRYRLLLHNAANIFRGLKWNWRAFIEGKIDAYMAEVRALEDYITNTSQAFADQTETMIKSLSDTMLAAVGVLIGSFIAALFQKDFNQTVFKIGMWIYAVYVLMFPLIYNMNYQWHRYEKIDMEFKARCNRFEERLYPDKVKEIMGTNITDSERSFKIWFMATFLAYIVVIISAFYAGIKIPEIMQHITQ